MAAGRSDLARAKQRRQKKILIVGGVLLGLVMVIQVPRTMKMLESKPAPVTNAAPAAAPATTTTADTAVPVSATPTTSAADASSAEVDGKLYSFSRFKTKDPFVAQVSESAQAAGADESAGSSAATSGASTGGSSGGSSGGGEAQVPFVSGDEIGASSNDPDAPRATMTVNGTEMTVNLHKSFPDTDGPFQLMKVGVDSVLVSIVGGSLKDAEGGVPLEIGEPVTLMNTADEKRYTLVLKSTSL